MNAYHTGIYGRLWDADPKHFFDEPLRKLSRGRRALYPKGDGRSNRPIDRAIDMPLVQLLENLASVIKTMSDNLENFMATINVFKNQEYVALQESLLFFEDCLTEVCFSPASL